MSQPGLNVSLTAVPGMTRRGILSSQLVIPVVVNEEFTHAKEGGHNDYDTVGAGSFSQPFGGYHAPRLRTTNLDGMAMTWDPAWMKEGGEDHAVVRAALEELADSRSPFHFFAWLPATGDVEVDMYATLRRFEARLRHGETDTRYFNLDVSQYRQPKLQRAGKRTPKLPTKHTLRAGDTLASLSQHYYLTRQWWRRIRDANGIGNWGSDDPLVQSKRFKAGDRLTIPVVPEIIAAGIEI
jgi:hypothetical protein